MSTFVFESATSKSAGTQLALDELFAFYEKWLREHGKVKDGKPVRSSADFEKFKRELSNGIWKPN